MGKMTGFVFQDEYLERLVKLSDQELGRLVRALATYHATGETQDLAGRESVAFDFIKVDIDRIEEKYSAKCATNRNNRQRSSTIVNDGYDSSGLVPKVKDKDKEKDIDNDDDNARVRETAFGEVEADPVIISVQSNLTGLTGTHYNELAQFREILGDDLVIHAIDETVGNSARSWNYTRAILEDYVRGNVRTVGEAKERSEKRKRKSQQTQAQTYTQRQYTESDLEARITEL